jgi:hypothetical protein
MIARTFFDVPLRLRAVERSAKDVRLGELFLVDANTITELPLHTYIELAAGSRYKTRIRGAGGTPDGWQPSTELSIKLLE